MVYLFSTGTVRPTRTGGEEGPGLAPGGAPLPVLLVPTAGTSLLQPRQGLQVYVPLLYKQ